jgi:acyl-CoA reductase-like NAD-dependent aldehyde dehydrogenase
MELNDILGQLRVDLKQWKGEALTAQSPIDGSNLAQLRTDSAADTTRKIDAAHAAFLKWRTVPAPQRGELVRLFATCCARTRRRLAASSRSKLERSPRKAWAKCRK